MNSHHDTFDRTIFNLQILGKIREQDRLYSNNNGLDVSGPSKFDCVYRSYHGETRTHNILSVKDILNTAFTLIESLLNKEESYHKENMHSEFLRRRQLEQMRTRQKLNRLESALGMARQGIKNWARTYDDDIKTVQSIENIVSSIDDNMVQIQISKKMITKNERTSESESGDLSSVRGSGSGSTSTYGEILCYKCQKNLHSGKDNSPCMSSPIENILKQTETTH